MKIAFVIDKHQTFQIISELLRTSLSRGHACTLFLCFELIPETFKFADIAGDISGFAHPDKSVLIEKITRERSQYDAIVGINMFNKGWNKLYGSNHNNMYALEYCWNEIYNTSVSVSGQKRDFTTSSTLFCNTETSMKLIQDAREPLDNLVSLGSPWYEFLMRLEKNKVPSKRITFMAPHNSFYKFDADLDNKTMSMIKNLRSYCDLNGMSLALKDRKKYINDYTAMSEWDEVFLDDDPFEHIKLYNDSDAVINFCSSGINELSFIETPYICVAPDYQKSLHHKIHEIYYSDEAFDMVHCEGIHSSKMKDKEVLSDKLDRLLSSNKDWKAFQDRLFPGNHVGSASRIADYIEDNYEKNKRISAIF